VHGGRATQRDKRSTSYSKRKKRSSRTHLLDQSTGGAVEKEEEGGSFNGAGDSRFGGSQSRARRRERGKGGGDVVFQLVAELVVERTRSEQQWPGLFIGRPCRFWRQDISRPPSSPVVRTRA
jgi:hypothetical protein